MYANCTGVYRFPRSLKRLRKKIYRNRGLKITNEWTPVRSVPLERSGYLAMDTQKFWDRLRISPAHAALSRDPKICNDLLRRRDPPARPLHAIGEVHQPQVE